MSIHWPYYCTVYVYAVINFCDSTINVYMWYFEWKRICAFFFIGCLYIHCCCRSSYQKWVSLMDLTQSDLYVCPKIGPRFPMSYVVVFFCAQWGKARKDCSFCWFWWNCWPLLFKLSLFCWYWWNCWPLLFKLSLFCWYWWNCWPSLFKLYLFCWYWWNCWPLLFKLSLFCWYL